MQALYIMLYELGMLYIMHMQIIHILLHSLQSNILIIYINMFSRYLTAIFCLKKYSMFTMVARSYMKMMLCSGFTGQSRLYSYEHWFTATKLNDVQYVRDLHN